jgi:hypothetical protein
MQELVCSDTGYSTAPIHLNGLKKHTWIRRSMSLKTVFNESILCTMVMRIWSCMLNSELVSPCSITDRQSRIYPVHLNFQTTRI